MKKLNQQHLLLSLLLLFVLMLSACRHDDTYKLMDKALDLQAQGKHEESVAALEQYVLGIRHETGDSSVQYAEGLFLLAWGRANLREFRQADSLFNASEQLLAAHSGTDSLRAEVYYHHGFVKLVEDEAEIADQLFDRGLNAINGHFNVCHPLSLQLIDGKADVQLFKADVAAAIPFLEKHLDCAFSSIPGLDPSAMRNAGELVLYYNLTERTKDALNLALKLVDQPDSVKEAFPREFAEVYETLGANYVKEGQPKTATTYFKMGLPFAERRDDTLSILFARFVTGYAEALDKSNDTEMARSQYERALRIIMKAEGATSEDVHKLAGEYIQFLRRNGDEQRAGEVELLISSQRTE